MDAIAVMNGCLRLDDNPTLKHAAQAGQRLVCVFVYDEILCGEHDGHVRTGPFRAQFLKESLDELDRQLDDLGHRLLIKQGNFVDVIAALCHSLNAPQVFMQAPVAYEERQQARRLHKRVPVNLCHGHCLIAELPFDVKSLPNSFTGFRKKLEAHWPQVDTVPAPVSLPPNIAALHSDPLLPLPTETVSDARRLLTFIGGARAGRERVAHYLGPEQCLSRYKETRNGLLSTDDASRFSPWLAHGCLSPRWLYQQVKAYETQYGVNDSTYWMVFELLWRDYFAFMAIRKGASFFGPAGLPIMTDTTRQWRQGETGEPFVDANMKELLATGYMSNRGRQNVASYLVHDLGQDWRLGADWFEYQLIDFDPTSNIGNWRYIAGEGQDPRGGRRFNVHKQAANYDPEGRYVDRWLAEVS